MPDEQMHTKEETRYRQGGDVCYACMHYEHGEGETGICHVVEGAIDGHDLCDLFVRKAGVEEEHEQSQESDMPKQANNMAKRGMISEKAAKQYLGENY
jgi:hypothetical protein